MCRIRLGSILTGTTARTNHSTTGTVGRNVKSAVVRHLKFACKVSAPSTPCGFSGEFESLWEDSWLSVDLRLIWKRAWASWIGMEKDKVHRCTGAQVQRA